MSSNLLYLVLEGLKNVASFPPNTPFLSVTVLLKDGGEMLKLVMLPEIPLFISPQEGFRTRLFSSETLFLRSYFKSCNKNQFNQTAWKDSSVMPAWFCVGGRGGYIKKITNNKKKM